MKKIIIALVTLSLIIILAVLGYQKLRGSPKQEEILPTQPPKTYVEVSLAERPFISLTPSVDGHWLSLDITRIQAADSLEYELTYDTADGLSQGAVGGPFKLEGDSYEKRILLGTESSGHYRYHEGVSGGTITIRLDGTGGTRRFNSDFSLRQEMDKLVSIDGRFALMADFSKSQFYVIMPTVGLPAELAGEIVTGPYGVFTSGSAKINNGIMELEGESVYYWDSRSWQRLQGNKVDGVGVFASILR
ncbi:MAG TPA: hypothetical protein VMW41_05045 [Candidatus Bathyarchaeia archaeon]|nr:hypothetical protein [Candidatus Bathyarchaeia archaeon]